MTETGTEETRLDIWLWRARFFKTRALATVHIAGKGIRLTRHGQTRKTDKPATRILLGDILTFRRADAFECVEILAIGERRGPAPEAQALYRHVTRDEKSQ